VYETYFQISLYLSQISCYRLPDKLKKMRKLVRNSMKSLTRQQSSMNRPYFVPYKLSLAQRAFLVPYFGIGAITDPRRGDLVAGTGDATSQSLSIITHS
jgi:hypothetical protein